MNKEVNILIKLMNISPQQPIASDLHYVIQILGKQTAVHRNLLYAEKKLGKKLKWHLKQTCHLRKQNLKKLIIDIPLMLFFLLNSFIHLFIVICVQQFEQVELYLLWYRS